MRSAFFVFVVSLFLLAGYCAATTPDVAASPAGVAQVQPTSYLGTQPPATPTGWWLANTAQNSFITFNQSNSRSFWANIGSVATVASQATIVTGSPEVPYAGSVAGWSAVGEIEGGTPWIVNGATSSILSTTAWTIGCAWQYNGAVVYASDAEVTIFTYPLIVGGTTGAGGDWGVFVGLGNSDNTAVTTSVWNYTGTHQFAHQQSSAGGARLPHVTVATLYGSTLYIALDGNAFTSVASGTSSQLGTALAIGGRTVSASVFSGNIAEVLLYNAGSAGLRAQVQSYLTTKYVGTGRDN